MKSKAVLFAGMGLVGVLAASPAMATFFCYCGGTDNNGCSASPTSYKPCVKDLKGDIRDLKCDIRELFRDIVTGKYRDIKGDIVAIKGDLKEIKFDISVLSSLKKK